MLNYSEIINLHFGILSKENEDLLRYGISLAKIYMAKIKLVLITNLKLLGVKLMDIYQLIPDFKYKDYAVIAGLMLIFSLLIFVFVRVLSNFFRVDHLKKGEKLLKKGKFERAKKHFLRSNAFTKAAFCSLKLTRVNEAAEFFIQAKEFEMAAKYYSLDGNYLKAAKIYEKVGKKIEAAEMYFKGGEIETAAQTYKALNLLKKAEEMFVKAEKFKEIALMYKEQFVKEFSTMPPSPTLKKIDTVKAFALKSSQYFSRIGEFSEAADILFKASLFREAVLAFAKMEDFAKAADLCLQIDDRDKAAQFFIKAKLFDKAIDIYSSLGKNDEVAEILEQAGKKSEASELRARLSIERKDVEHGARHLEDAGKLIEAAELYLSIKKLPKAAELYEKGNDFDKAAEVYEKLKDFTKAAELYKRVNRFKSAANCYKDLGDERSYLEMLLLGESYLEAAKYYFEQENTDAAIEVLQKIEIDSPDYRMACNMLGRIFFSKNILGLAEEKLSKAVEGKEMNKRNLDLFYDLAVFKESNGDEKNALTIYEKILSFDFYFKDVQDRRKIIEANISSISQKASLATEMDETPPKAKLKSEVINNRYEITEEIGRGGMGVVYKALDRSLDRIVALKFLPSDFIRNTRDIEKFINEAKSAAKLNHRNIVTIHNIDQMEGDYFIVMEFVDGANLKEIIDLAHNLPFKTIHLIAQQICDALSYAHKQNVIHRDIKNANIMWTNEKIVKVTDFGLAKILEDGLKTSTRVQGSPVYMSPEQVLGKDIDLRTDIYSFGISLYEMVTGKVPFERGDIGYHHLNTIPEPPEAIRSDTPPYLAKIIKKCLNKRQEDRYKNAAEILIELSQSPKV